VRHTIHKARSRLSYPEAVDHPDQPRDGSDKPLRSGSKIDRSPTDHGRTLPITIEEPTEEVGDRRSKGSDRAAADRERGLDKRENDPEQAVIGMIGWFFGDDILLDLFSAGPEVRSEGGWVRRLV
jgi:hypothetical protein